MTQPPPKMHVDEIEVTDTTVRDLVSSQFPRWSERSLIRLPDSGTDSAIYRLGDDLGIRLPRIHWAVEQVDKEWHWLQRLASSLPISIPVPIGKGEPGEGYPYPWLVYPWVEGESLDRAPVDDWGLVAARVGSFVLALEALSPPAGAPRPRRRGGPLAAVDREARWAISNLDGLFDVDRAIDVWQAAIDVGPWTGDPVWVHGDLLPGNVVVRDHRLAGVIDWSGLGVGDPACDAMFAWSLPPRARSVYREVLGFDEATWARARGWVVEQTAMYIPYYEKTLPDGVEEAKRRLQAALDDPGPRSASSVYDPNGSG